MSRVSEIYDAITTYLSTTYTSRKRFSDAIDIGANSDLLLASGYGLRMDSSELTPRSILGSVSFRRNITVILTNLVSGMDTDNAKRDKAIKTLFEDQYLLFQALQQNSIVPETTNLVSDNGILEVPTDRASLLMIETIFTVEYFEDCA